MKKKTNDSKVILALDTSSLDVAKKLIKEVEGVIGYYKIGFELFTAHGWAAVDLVKKAGGKVFLDLKLHDIPNTVAKSAAVICEHEVDMFNVHTLGGFEMMKEVRKTVDERAKGKKKPVVIGVTILTSHTEKNLSEDLGIKRGLNEQVLHLAGLAEKAGLDGVVSSPQEITLIRGKLPKDFLIVTPGIRPAGSDKGDQKRTFTPQDALQAGCDYMVIGRPIYAAAQPRKAAAEILESLGL
jgi:orotidine-5'-phosphate decarboxylase